MWTLLSAGPPPQDRRPEAANGAADGASRSPQATNGAGRESDRAVRVYLHPGRSLVAVIDLSRAIAQFDLTAGEFFESLVAAERSHQAPGFLLEIMEPFIARDGGQRERGVLYLGGLRR